jgi:transposase-like protein
MARHRSEVERKREVERWRSSGVSVRDYCAAHGMSQESLRRWSLEVDAAGGAVAPTFVRVEVARGLRERGGLVVEIGRVRVRVERGFDGVVLRELVEVLASASAP